MDLSIQYLIYHLLILIRVNGAFNRKLDVYFYSKYNIFKINVKFINFIVVIYLN